MCTWANRSSDEPATVRIYLPKLFLYWTQVCGQIRIYSFLHGKTNMSVTSLIKAFSVKIRQFMNCEGKNTPHKRRNTICTISFKQSGYIYLAGTDITNILCPTVIFIRSWLQCILQGFIVNYNVEGARYSNLWKYRTASRN